VNTLLVALGDAAARRRLSGLLRSARYEVVEAADGAQALALSRAAPPHAIVADVAVPMLGGFELVAAIRADAALAAMPLLLVVEQPDAATMRRAMQAGADDCVAATIPTDELLQAIAALLRKQRRRAEAFERAVRQRLAAWRRHWAAATARSRRDESYGLAAAAGSSAQRQVPAAVLFADIRNFSALAEMLDSTEVAELLAAYFERACRPVLAHGGSHLKFIGDGLMSVFTAGADGAPASRRALSAALGVALAAHGFRGWVDERFAGRALPPFAIGVGVHAGPVTLCRFGAGAATEVTAIGDAVNVAARLEAASKELGWTVVASRVVLDGAGAGVQTRGQAALALRGRKDPVEVVEVTGLDHVVGAPAGPAGSATAVRAAVELNSALAAAAPAGSPVTVVAEAGRRRRGA
jgi:class 3 adenylate cyclase/CheY-like chemotaxis protein